MPRHKKETPRRQQPRHLVPAWLTPTIRAIRQHYEEVGLGKWNRNRILRLCRWLRCTPDELGAMAAIEHASMTKYLQAFSRVPLPVALHFTILESCYLDVVRKEPQEPIMPVHLIGHSNA